MNVMSVSNEPARSPHNFDPSLSECHRLNGGPVDESLRDALDWHFKRLNSVSEDIRRDLIEVHIPSIAG